AVQSTPTPRSVAVPYPASVPIDGPLAPGAPHVLFLNYDGGMLTYGNCSNAQTNCSFLLKQTSTGCMFMPYTNATRKPMITAQVQAYYAPFNVQVVATRPTSGTYSMVMIGPDTSCVNIPAAAAGVGPLDCGDLRQSDITFAFDCIGQPYCSNTTAAVHAI